jgi:uncharacterized protein (TIRG00374 family)
MQDAVARSRFPWHALLIGALTVALLWWFFHNLDVGEVWRAVKHSDLRLLAVAVVSTVVVYVFRAWRWQALLLPIGDATFRNAFRITVMGFTASNLLPGKLGEVMRPYLLSRAQGFDAAAAFATVIIERVLDLSCVLLLFSLFLATTSIDVGPDVRFAGIATAAAAILALGSLVIGAGHPERLGRWAGHLTRALPGKISAVVSRFVRTFVEGLAVMRRPGALFAAFLLSFGVWLTIAAGIWLVAQAFDLTFPFTGSFLVMLFLVAGVALPTPAGLGGFQVMFVWATTEFLGAGKDPAAACALVLHAVSFVPVSVMGLWFMTRDGLSLRGLNQMRSTAEAAEKPAMRTEL